MSTVILAVLGAVTVVIYFLKRRARLRAEQASDNNY
jgi:hypothetical protein